MDLSALSFHLLAVLQVAQKTDSYLKGLAVMLTTICVYGLVFRPKHQILRMETNSLPDLIIHFFGVAGLFLLVDRKTI